MSQPTLEFPPSRIRTPKHGLATVRHWFDNGYVTYSPDGLFVDVDEKYPCVHFCRQSEVIVIS